MVKGNNHNITMRIENFCKLYSLKYSEASKRVFLSFIFILLLGFSSCVDELATELPWSGEETVELTVMVPEYGSEFIETRSNLTQEEASYSNIYLIAANTDYNKLSIFNITQDLGEIDNEGYRKTSIVLATGNYRFYVVANLNQYIDGTIDQYVKNENTIQTLIDNFSTPKQITPGNLPMACSPKDIQVNGVNKDGNNIISITNSEPTIKADMTILCAKVTYTILFDSREGGISSSFADKKDISFIVNMVEARPYANKVKGLADFDDITSLYLNDPEFSSDLGKNSLGEWSHNDNVGFTDNWSGVAEHYNKIYETYKEYQDMSKGIYRLEADGFYRYGNIENAWKAHQNGTEKLLAKLYINESESSFMSLYEGGYEDPETDRAKSEKGFPDGVVGANLAFNVDGNYKGNSVTYLLATKGTLRFGIKKTVSQDYDWTCFDNFKLYYQSFETALNNSIPLELNRYTFDNNIIISDSNFNLEELSIASWDNTNEDLQDWHTLDHKAWQGVVYLPENLTSTKTELHFPYTYGDSTEKIGEKTVSLFNDSQGLERGYSYNIVALVKDVNKFPTSSASLETLVSKSTFFPLSAH